MCRRRRTNAGVAPFADKSVPTMVSYVGLSRVEDPGGLMRELRRGLSVKVFAISIFYHERKGPNADAIRRFKMEPLLYRDSSVRQFEEVRFKVTIENAQSVLGQPTPVGTILKEAQTGGLPMTETQVEWCTLVANRARVS
ncbi:MAG: hypothetical protein JRN35_10630 [Nitrososphaerota archaeon]|nr:hypothetical protein [Nitrososphaerota archaeon]